MNMKNSKRLEKSRGIIAFANNTDTVNYVEIATRTLSIASKTLNLPYQIITTSTNNHNSRFDIDSKKFVWGLFF